MNEEINGLNIILISILCSILFFTYCAIPTQTPVKSKDTAQNPTHNVSAEMPPDSDNSITESSDHDVKEEMENTVQSEVVHNVEKTQNQNSNDLSIIMMNNPKYKTHKKPIVAFTHQRHVEEYKIDCGSCHHDEKGKPLSLTYEDKVQSCILCHPGTEKIKGEKLSKKEKIMKYHTDAIHANCIGCHKTFNIDNGDPKGKKPAPTSCNTCHPKK